MSFVYYGLILNTEHLSGNFFLNFFFGALVELPGYTICIVLLNRVGRKKLYIAFMVIGGIAGILSVLPNIYASEGKENSLFFIFILFHFRSKELFDSFLFVIWKT